MREKNIKILKDQRSLGTLDMADIAFSVKTFSFKSGLLEEWLRYSPFTEGSVCVCVTSVPVFDETLP